MAVLARALGIVLRDVVLTPEEIRGLTCGLLASRQPALGQVSFIEWLKESGPTLGRGYASELDHHFRTRKTWSPA